MGKFSTKTIVIFVITAAVVVYMVSMLMTGGTFGTQKGGERAVLPSVHITPVYAENGRIASGFPKELILDERGSVSNSYAINYDQNLKQYTTEFDSEQSMEELYDAYRAYFEESGWTIVNAITKYPGSRGLYAKKGQTDASVAILDNDRSSKVVISYVVK